MIKLGTSDMAKAYVGSTEVSKVYLGSELVYSSAPTYDAEIAYLEGTGTQYIDTGFSPTNTCGMYVKVCATQLNGSTSHIGGASGNASNSRWNMNYTGTKKIAMNWNSTRDTGYSPTVEVYDILESNYLNSRYAYINGVQKVSFSTTLATVGRSAYIFSTHTQSGFSNPLVGRISEFKISKGSDIEMDFIPVRVGQVGYMYDKISGKLFGNAGTGSFVLGPDVV